jgi:hypothetical protein
LKTPAKKGPKFDQKMNKNVQFFQSTGKHTRIYGKSSASSIENISEITMSINQNESIWLTILTKCRSQQSINLTKCRSQQIKSPNSKSWRCIMLRVHERTIWNWHKHKRHLGEWNWYHKDILLDTSIANSYDQNLLQIWKHMKRISQDEVSLNNETRIDEIYM